MTKNEQTLLPKCDLEEENQLLRMEIDRLKKILAAHGLHTASALTNQEGTVPPVVLQQPENRQARQAADCPVPKLISRP